MSGDRLAQIEARIRDGYFADGRDVLALVEIAKAAREVEDTLRIHARGVALIGARHKLYDALARLDSGAAEEDA